MRETQRSTNPYPHSDSNKRYQTFDYYMKKRFGGKCARIAIDAGFSCPNKDGTKGHGGCIFCYGGSSGSQGAGSVKEQYEAGIKVMQRKWQVSHFVPYLQANTNTYAPLSRLEEVYSECAELEGAVMLAIGTRPDCLSDGVIDLLVKTSKKIPLLVELGLQSVHDSTAEVIHRGHTMAEFCDGYERLRRAGGDILISVHLINGLPCEDREMMLESARQLALLRPDMVKIHLLHVIENTPLAEMYRSGAYTPMDREQYIEVTADQIELFHPDTVIARLTGDAPQDLLCAPDWCRKKTAVTNDIDKLLYERKTYQGAKYAYTNK